MGFAKDLYRSVLRVLPEKPALYLIYFRGYQNIKSKESTVLW